MIPYIEGRLDLEKCRNSLGLSYTQMSKLLETSQTTYFQWEKNPDMIPWGQVRRIVSILNKINLTRKKKAKGT